MKFLQEALRDRPYRIYACETQLPWTDYSGAGVGTAFSDDGSSVLHAGLTSGVNFSSVLSANVRINIPSMFFKSGTEKVTFTAEAWVKPITATTYFEQQILGNLDKADGLTIKGSVVSFVQKFATAPVAITSYDLQVVRAFYVAVIHTAEKNSLFVDGELVAETTLTDAQRADSLIATTSTSLHGGKTSGTSKVAVGGLAIYDRALSNESIKRHYRAGLRGPSMDEVATANAAQNVSTSIDGRVLFMEHSFDSDEEFSFGRMLTVSSLDGVLTPQFNGSVSLPGSWTTVVSLSDANATSIYGMQLDWDGLGVIVETSSDGTNYTAAVRGVNVSTITSGTNPTNKILYLRVRFPGGVTNDTAFLNRLTVRGLSSGAVISTFGRNVTYTKAHPEYDFRVMEFNDNWGAQIDTGGNIVISSDTSSEALPTRTLEVWVKPATSTLPTFSVTGTTYINGATGGSLVAGQWSLIHIVSSSDVAGAVTINGQAQIGGINIYSTALTASQVSSIFSQYMGSESVRVVDGANIVLADFVSSVNTYSYDWSMQTSI